MQFEYIFGFIDQSPPYINGQKPIKLLKFKSLF